MAPRLAGAIVGSRSGRAGGGSLAAAEEGGRDLAHALDVDQAAGLAFVVGRERLAGRLGDVDPAGQAVRLEPAREVHRVAPDVVDELVDPDHAGDHRPGVDADPDLERDLEGPVDPLERGEHGEGELGHRRGLAGPRLRQARRPPYRRRRWS